MRTARAVREELKKHLSPVTPSPQDIQVTYHAYSIEKKIFLTYFSLKIN